MKIILLVEGQTEKVGIPEFLRRWLYTRAKGLSLRPVCFRGTPNYLKLFARRTCELLEAPDVTGVLGLLDLHGCRQPFPAGLAVDERYRWAKERLEGQVDNFRFRQHFAVHETEAWLLSRPDLFPREVRTHLYRTHLPKASPEMVNLTNPPSAVLATAYRRAFKNRSYSKTKGAGLFRKLDPELTAAKCPHLQLLLDDLLELAKGA